MNADAAALNGGRNGAIGRILVVDDHDDARAVCVDVLRSGGFDVADAATGAAALAQLKADPHFDVLISDLVMPEQDGLSVMHAAREFDPHLEVIILTGHATIQTAKQAIREGAFDYLTKPFEMDGLLQVALQATRTSQVRRRNAELGELWALAELGQTLTSTLDLDVLSARVLEAVKSTFSPTGSALFVVDGENLELVERSGLTLEFLEEDSLRCEAWVRWALAREKPLLLFDDDVPDVLLEPARGSGVLVSAALVPLRLDEQAVGLLVLVRHGGRPYGQDDARRLQLLAATIAIALDNARRYRQRQREVIRNRRDMAALHRVAALAAEGLDAEQLIEAALPVVSGAVGLTGGALALLTRNGLLVRRDGSPPDALAELALERDEPQFVSRRSVPGAVSFAALPLRAGNGHLGVLELWSPEPHYFTPDEELLLSSMSNQLALALHNSRLLSAAREYAASIQHRNQELAAWNRVAAAVAESLDLHRVLRDALDAVLEVTSGEIAVLYLCDESGEILRPQVWSGLTDEQAAIITEISDRTSVLSDVVTRAALYWSNEPSELPEAMAAIGLVGGMIVPIEAPTQVVGALAIGTRFPDRRFTRAGAELLRSIGRQIGLAVQNSRRYEQARRDLHVKEALLREAHHRIKNNLQTISSLLVLEESYAADPAAREVLRTVRQRLRSIAAVHRTLSYGDVEARPLHELIQRIAEPVLTGLLGDPTPVQLEIVGDDINVNSKYATALAIILNELLTNAVKYDIRRGTTASLTLLVSVDGKGTRLQLRDSGTSWPAGFDLDRDAGLGLTIVRSLVMDELGGEFTIEEGRWPTVLFPHS